MRFRPAIALFLAYALTIASVLGALSSASLAGTSHIQFCVTSAQDGKPLPPAHSSDLGLCCFVVNGGSPPALLPEEIALAQSFLYAAEKFSVVVFSKIAGTENSSSYPRAPPVRN